MKIGDVLLPAGSYKVTTVEEAGQHTMVFKPRGKSAAELRVKCTVESLPQKAERSQQQYNLGPKGEYVLVGLVFEGEMVRHVFR
jgi:hypothetical protein